MVSFFSSTNRADQVAVFERRTFVSRPKTYNRVNYYKAGLIIGGGRINYAHRGIEIDRPTLLFSNPMVPYTWEPGPAQQEGYFCLFTPEFLKARNADRSTQGSPLFCIGADPIFF